MADAKITGSKTTAPKEFEKIQNYWVVQPKGCSVRVNLVGHKVTEHDDGTISTEGRIRIRDAAGFGFFGRIVKGKFVAE